MKVAIHQPEHLPWLGFFHKINMADAYVVLDDVQYRRRYFQNRNKIRTKDGWRWIVVPLKKVDRDELLIKDAQIARESLSWRKDNLQTIYQNYCRARFFAPFWEEFKSIYGQDFKYLMELNLELIKFIFKSFGIKKQIILSSDLDVGGDKGDLIFNICKSIGAKRYISGISGREYLDLKKFDDNGIEVLMQEFHHPVYEQLYFPFMPCMSVIDLLFNYGDEGMKIINGIGIPVMQELFL